MLCYFTFFSFLKSKIIVKKKSEKIKEYSIIKKISKESRNTKIVE